MSQVLWKKIIAPDSTQPIETLFDEHFKSSVENVRRLPMASSEIAIPNPKAFRSMSRASLLMSNLAMDAQPFFAAQAAKDPFSIGIYCAVENGPIDAPSTAKISSQPKEQFVESYRKLRNPKMYLKQLPNIVPAQLGIFFGLQGPMNVYTHSRMAGFHAIDQAQQDLRSGSVAMALVCTAHAFDDFFIVKRTRQQDPRTLAEGAAALLLGPSSESSTWRTRVDPDHYFGIGDPIINLVKGVTDYV